MATKDSLYNPELTGNENTTIANVTAQAQGYNTPLTPEQKIANQMSNIETVPTTTYTGEAKQNTQTGMWYDPSTQSYTSKTAIGSLPASNTTTATGSPVVSTGTDVYATEAPKFKNIDEALAYAQMRGESQKPNEASNAIAIDAENQRIATQEAITKAQQEALGKATRGSVDIATSRMSGREGVTSSAETGKIDSLKKYAQEQSWNDPMVAKLQNRAVNISNQLQSIYGSQQAQKNQAVIDKLVAEGNKIKTELETEQNRIAENKKSQLENLKLIAPHLSDMTEEEQINALKAFDKLDELTKQSILISAKKTQSEIDAEKQKEFQQKVTNTDNISKAISSMIINGSTIDYNTAQYLSNGSLFSADQILGIQGKAQDIATRYKKGTPEYENEMNSLVNGIKGELITKEKKKETDEMANIEAYQALMSAGKYDIAEKFAQSAGMNASQKATAARRISGVISGTALPINSLGEGMRTDRHLNPLATKAYEATKNILRNAGLVEGKDWIVGETTAGVDDDGVATIAYANEDAALKGSIASLAGGQLGSWYANPKYGGSPKIISKISELSGQSVNSGNAQSIFNSMSADKQAEVVKEIYKHEGGKTLFSGEPKSINLAKFSIIPQDQQTMRARANVIAMRLGGTGEERTQVIDDLINLVSTGQAKDLEEAGKIMGVPTGGKQLSQNQITALAEGANMPALITDLSNTVNDPNNEWLFSFGKSWAREIDPRNWGGWDTQALSVDAKVRAVRQMIGKYMEGGVLRKEDEEKYMKMLPQIGDEKEVAKAKINQLSQSLARDVISQVEALGKAGYDISPFEDTLNSLGQYVVEQVKSETQADSISDKYGTNEADEILTKYYQ